MTLVGYMVTRDPRGEAEKMHAYLEKATNVARCEITVPRFLNPPYVTTAIIGEIIDRKVYFVENENQVPPDSRLFDRFEDAFAWAKGKDNTTTYCITATSLDYTHTTDQIAKMVPFIRRIEQNIKNRTLYTTVIWEDGSKPTVVKCAKDDPDDLYFAVASAIAIKMHGSNSAYKRMIKDKMEVK